LEQCDIKQEREREREGGRKTERDRDKLRERERVRGREDIMFIKTVAAKLTQIASVGISWHVVRIKLKF
jgi:hypothetical protein